jgi:hypothetical protein
LLFKGLSWVEEQELIEIFLPPLQDKKAIVDARRVEQLEQENYYFYTEVERQ